MKKNKLQRIDPAKLKIKKVNELEWEIEIELKIKKPKEIGGHLTNIKKVRFEYYKDNQGNYWLANCEVPQEFQGQGIGSMMIDRAIKDYGQVYFSKAKRFEYCTKYPKHDYDSRYLTTMGEKFVNSLIKRNLIPIDWYRFP